MTRLKAEVLNAAGSSVVLNLKSAYDVANSGYGIAITDPENLLDLGAQTWRRTMVSSPFMHGDQEVHAVLAMASASLTLLVMHPSHTEVRNILTTIVNAFTQSAYRVKFTLIETEGQTETGTQAYMYEWHCLRADWSIRMNRKFIHAHAPEIKLVFPRHPVAVQGPL